jgi:hypothetical protein
MNTTRRSDSTPRDRRAPRVRWPLAVLLALLVLPRGAHAQTASATAPALDPRHTWVFAVEILAWRDADAFPAFDTSDRRSAQMVAAFRAWGVPADQIVSLTDRAATRAGIARAVAAQLGRTQPGDTLWFYFDGHGALDEDDRAYLVPYDADDDLEATAIPVAAVVDAVERGFRGARVLFTSDACYSGAFADEVRARRSRIAYAALTSVQADGISADSWTYTDLLLAALRGDARMDANGDGVLTLREVAGAVASELSAVEDQRAAFAASPGFPAVTAISRAARVPSASGPERTRAGEAARTGTGAGARHACGQRAEDHRDDARDDESDGDGDDRDDDD